MSRETELAQGIHLLHVDRHTKIIHLSTSGPATARNPPDFSHWHSLCRSTIEKLYFTPGPNLHTVWPLRTRASCGEGAFLQFSLGAISIITWWTLMAPFSSFCNMNLDLVTFMPKSAYPPHFIKASPSLNIKHPLSEDISSRAEEPGNYKSSFRHLSPAWCSSSRSFSVSSTRVQRIQPMILLACGTELGRRTTIKKTLSCNWVTVTLWNRPQGSQSKRLPHSLYSHLLLFFDGASPTTPLAQN